MENLKFKIVFKGEIGFDFGREEVMENLSKFCGFDRGTIERLFSGGSFVLKKDIDRTKADQLREAFQKLGAFVEVVQMPLQEAAPASATPTSQPVATNQPAAPGTFRCPACGMPQAEGENCVVCGVYFAKLARARERKAREQMNAHDSLSSPVVVEPVGQGRGAVFDRLTAQPFLYKCGLLIVGLSVLRGMLGPDLASLGFIILPCAWLLGIMIRAMFNDQGVLDGVGENLDFVCERSAPFDRRRQWLPWCTYGIILLDLLLYYALAARLDPAALADNLAFFPAAPNFWNVPLSTFASLFLHVGGGQLWGCVAFLWIVGPGVEKRLGRGRFVSLYLLSGVASGMAGALLHPLLGQGGLHALGSSGAIAGLLGLFVAWREDSAVEFTLPVIDLASLLAPATVSARLDVFALIGLFFYADLGGSVMSHDGSGALFVGYLVHVAGLAAAMLAGILFWKVLAPAPAALEGAAQRA